MNCRSCGLENRPTESSCANCQSFLQAPEEAATRLREWNLLPPILRSEQEKYFSALRERFDEHRRWLKRHRLTHALLGGMIVGGGMNAAVFFAVAWSVPIDFALGAGAGLLLNRLGGGAYRGLSLFTAAGFLSVVFLLPGVHREIFWGGLWLLSAVAILFIAGAGYLLGLKIDADHVEHQVL